MNDLQEVCNGTYIGKLSPACEAAEKSFRAPIVGINPYNIYAQCHTQSYPNEGCFTTAMAEVSTSLHWAFMVADDVPAW